MIKLLTTNIYHFSKQLIQKTGKQLIENQTLRLSKWISMKSLCSRRQAQQFIKLGLVRINGKRIYQNILVPQHSNMKAFTSQGLMIQKPVTQLWMINKPRGYICSRYDPENRPTIYQLLPPEFKMYGHVMSVGRLDYNSEGLLLLTNDSQLKNLLENPMSNMNRVYRVKVHGRVTPEKLLKMSKPIIMNGKQYGPLHVTVNRALTTNVWLNISMKTGKNRQIRRIMQKCDLQVNKLIRLQYGKYKLKKLQHKQIKELPISLGLDRKLKITKAKILGKNRTCLIQIDTRQNAIKIASIQRQQRMLEQSNYYQNGRMLEFRGNNVGQFPINQRQQYQQQQQQYSDSCQQ